MNTSITLISNPKTPALNNQALTKRLHQELSAFANGDISHKILCDGVAEDFCFDFAASRDNSSASHDDPSPLEAQCRAALDPICAEIIGDQPIDFAIQQTTARRKQLLIADMDSTIIEQECIDELAEFAGKRSEISDITERAMRGELDFEAALNERVAMLKGLPERVLQETFEKAITLAPGARILVQTMNKLGAVTALISGGFTFFTERVSAATGFQSNRANSFIIENATLTGAVKQPILGKQAKLDALNELLTLHALTPEQSIAVGDGANDLAMLNRAGVGVAIHAKPAVAAAADVRINHSDLTALLYLQGIPQRDFATH